MCACVRVACAHVCMRVCHASVRVPCVCVYVRMHTRVHTTRTHFLWARPRELHAGSPKTDVHAHVARAHAACAHACAHTRAHAHAHTARAHACAHARSHARTHTHAHTNTAYAYMPLPQQISVHIYVSYHHECVRDSASKPRSALRAFPSAVISNNK